MKYMLEWDKIGEHFGKCGIDHMVLYRMNRNTGIYENGVVWNGITGYDENPDGGEPNDQYADNIKYLSLLSAENYKATLKAFTYPAEFEECDGSRTFKPEGGINFDAIHFGQQGRAKFGLCYRTLIVNDTADIHYGYTLHLVYGLMASPSERSHSTINDSPEIVEMSWDLNSVPIVVPQITGQENAILRPVSTATIDIITDGANKTPTAFVEAIEKKLYGVSAAENGGTAIEPTLLLPDEIYTIAKETLVAGNNG